MNFPLRVCLVAVLALFLVGPAVQPEILAKPRGKGRPSDVTIAAGLKEALAIGTGNAVISTGQPDGFLKNEAIKIQLPKELQKLDEALRIIGLDTEIDDFVLSMNRAAEHAAPAAKSIFTQALAEMTFDDAKKILGGGDTAATDYFRAKTSERLTAAFMPIVSSSLGEAGATKQYKDLVEQYLALPFMKSPELDLDHYVTGKALDGLFHVLGEEERKIRKDPTARVTSLLREVFARG